jgi:hypothetical protein
MSRIMLGAAAIAALGLTGCTAAETGKITPPPTGAAASAGAAVKADTPKEPTVAKVGGTFTYPSKLAVSVVSISRTTFDAYAAGHKAGNVGVKVVVKITNGTAEPVDLDMAIVNLKTGAAGAAAEQVFTSGVGGFEGKVAAGRAATATLGFSVAPADMGLMSIEIKPTLGSDSALVEGTLK